LVTVRSGGPAFAVTVAEQVPLPPALETVRVYVVVEAGDTAFVPLVGGATGPTPLSMLALVGLPVVIQERVEDWPWSIVGGLAVSVQVGNKTGVTVVICVARLFSVLDSALVVETAATFVMLVVLVTVGAVATIVTNVLALAESVPS